MPTLAWLQGGAEIAPELLALNYPRFRVIAPLFGDSRTLCRNRIKSFRHLLCIAPLCDGSGPCDDSQRTVVTVDSLNYLESDVFVRRAGVESEDGKAKPG